MDRSIDDRRCCWMIEDTAADVFWEELCCRFQIYLLHYCRGVLIMGIKLRKDSPWMAASQAKHHWLIHFKQRKHLKNPFLSHSKHPLAAKWDGLQQSRRCLK